jgi:L-asparagine transporter-like permease
MAAVRTRSSAWSGWVGFATGWARWFAIVVVSINVLGQLGFVGAAQYPLWALTVVGLSVVVLYALIVRWEEASAVG